MVLDLGCGASPRPAADQPVCSMDVSLEALRKARKMGASVLVCGRGEQLPFRDGCFRQVISDVALPYMDIKMALSGIARILAPDGSIWLSLHPASMTVKELLRATLRGNLKNAVYRLYILANGLTFAWWGWQFYFPAKRTRCESFQTKAGMKREMAARGFTDIQWQRGRQFIVTAKKSRL